MTWVYFKVKPTPLDPQEVKIRAPMPVVPRIGETLVFPYRDNTWPRFEVAKVEYFVHQFRKEGDPPTLSEELAGDDDDVIRRDEEQSMSVEVYIELIRLDSDASRNPHD